MGCRIEVTMNSILKLLFGLSVIIIANGKSIDSDFGSNSKIDPVIEIYEFWEKQDKFFHLGEQKDVVLFLGDTGSGKSSTALFVTGANLNAVASKNSDDSVDSVDLNEEIEYSDDDAVVDDEYSPNSVVPENIFITDANNKIGNETINSHTLIPELLTDESGVAYYDCPGFGDTRQPKHELTIAFFLKKLMTYADSFKLVFVVTHSSVKKGEDRKSFLSMIRNAMKLIKNIGNYRKGIGLIVTKVDLTYSKDAAINSVAEFLNEVKKSINNTKNDLNLSEKERSDSNELLNALLLRKRYRITNSNKFVLKYSRIEIFHRPDKVQPLDSKEERDNLKKMINETLTYVRKQNNDFGIVISERAIAYTIGLTNKIIQDGFGSDMANICREIKEFYLKKEDLTSDISELYKISKFGIDLLSAIRNEDPRLFLKEILNATCVLDISVSNNTIEPILKHIESIDFLMTVVNQTLTHQLQVNDIVKYLKNSQNWYGFLMFLEEELTNIGFQNDNVKNVARNIIDNLKTFENDGNEKLIESVIHELKPLLEKSANNKIPYIDEISSIETSNLKALKNILNEFSNDKLETTCSSNYDMEVKGHVIKMSDVIKDDCFNSTKNIKIFALNKLIIDESINKTGQQAQLLIIAPTWDIIGNRTFNLDGENGKNHSHAFALNGTGIEFHPRNGKPGLPGLPGSPGGNFFAIGSKFLHGDYLTIQANGGHGGAGQHGGNGTLCIEGKDPYFSKDKCPLYLETQWKENNFTFEKSKPDYMEYEYKVHGRNGTKAGDGGDGGRQGDPGLAGKIVIFELDQVAHLKTYTIDGLAGAIGKGGLGGGGETQNGKDFHVKASHLSNRYAGSVAPTNHPCESKKLKTIDKGKHDAGKNGNDNENTLNMKNANPPSSFIHPLFAVNEYKSFAREHLIGSSRKTEINIFLNQITNNETLKAQYGSLDLINEFLSIENQYFRMREQIYFIPHLESLLSRTDEFARATTVSTEQKKVLAYLYTAILSKITGISNKVYNNTVYNLDNFLELAERNINELRDSIDENNMNIVRNDFNSSLNEKVRSAEELIKTQIIPVITAIFEEVDEQIETLITESIEMQNGVIKNIADQNELRTKLEANLRLRWILAPIKVIAVAANAFGPYGSAVGTVLNGGTMVMENMLLNKINEKGNNNISPIVTEALKKNMEKIAETLKKNPDLVQQKINDLYDFLKNELPDNATTASMEEPDEIQKIKIEISRSKADIDKLNNQLVKRIKNGDIAILRDLMQRCDEIEKKLGKMSEEAKEVLEKRLSEEKDEKKQITEKLLKIVSHVQTVVNVVDISIKTYNQIHKDEDKLQVVSAAIGSLQKDLEVLKDHEGKIHNVLIPQIGKIQSNINEMSKNLKGNSHVELDVKKWNIRSTLSDVKVLFKQMTKDFSSVHESLGLSIKKLDEGMATLIDVYKQIDSYSYKAQFAAYIKNIASPESLDIAIGDTELSDAVSKLKQMIQSNIVLDEYELAMHAFKQHYFPIANSFMKNFELPNSLQMNDTNAIVEKSIYQINELMKRIKSSRARDTIYDDSLHTEAKFDGFPRSEPPFYTWKYHEYKDQIKDLLKGKEITIKADVTRGVNQNAVKFNKIGIRFKLSNATLQNELNNLLYDNFKVSMSMVGTNYYRCNNRYYQITLDHNINLKLWLEKDLLNPPNDPDEIYRKIYSNPAFLSPYGMWSIKFIKGDINKLTKFIDHALDMDLIGVGQYLEHGEFSNSVCNNQLDNYYHFDESISNVNTLLLPKGL